MSLKENLFLLILSLVFVCETTAQTTDLNDSLSINKIFSIEVEFEEPGHFLDVKAITTDSKGNIFVADNKRTKINMYDNKGNFLQSFGKSGRGPGEFNEITDVAVNSNDQLYVLDRMSYKISRFDISGGDVEEHLFEDLNQLNMTSIVSLSENYFAGVYSESVQTKEEPVESKPIVRKYKFGTGTMERAFLNIFEYRFNQDTPLEQRFGEGIGYHLTTLNDKHVAVGHNVYDGRLYIVNTEDGDVTVTDNPNIKEPFYIEFEEDPAEDESLSYPGIIRSFGPTGNFFYQIINRTMMLDATANHLLHIIRMNEPEGNRSSLYMEIYNSDGMLILSQETPEIAKPEEARYQNFLHIDENNRLYIVNFFDDRDPEILVYKISWSD